MTTGDELWAREEAPDLGALSEAADKALAAWIAVDDRFSGSEANAYREAQSELNRAVLRAYEQGHLLDLRSEAGRGLVEALRWYEDRAAGCRLIHSGGDADRQALDADGGKRARAALALLDAMKEEPHG